MSFWDGEGIPMPGGVVAHPRSMATEAQDPSSPCPMYLFIWLSIWILYHNKLYNKLVSGSKCFLKLCELF